MGGGLIESSGPRHHYEWISGSPRTWPDVLDAYSEHIYWWYDRPGRLEYRLRDTRPPHDGGAAAEQRKPALHDGVRRPRTERAATKPEFQHLYYVDAEGTCPEVWRTNIAAFQQLWFNIASAQLGVAGTAKWDAIWGRYDRSSAGNQLYWMIGPPTEGSPLTPTYHAMSLLFRTTRARLADPPRRPVEAGRLVDLRLRRHRREPADDQAGEGARGYAGQRASHGRRTRLAWPDAERDHGRGAGVQHRRPPALHGDQPARLERERRRDAKVARTVRTNRDRGRPLPRAAARGVLAHDLPVD